MTLEENENNSNFVASISSSVVVENNKGELLLLKKVKECLWTFPAGKMKPHENPMMTAIREFKEETSSDVTLLFLVGVYTIDRGEEKTSIGFVFAGRVKNDVITPDGREIIDFGYFNNLEIDKLIRDKLLYKPMLIIRVIDDWRSKKKFPLDTIVHIQNSRLHGI